MPHGLEANWTVRVFVGRVEEGISGRDPLATYFDNCIAHDPRATPTVRSSRASAPDCEEAEVVACFQVAAETWEQACEVAEDIRHRALASAGGIAPQGWTMSTEVEIAR